MSVKTDGLSHIAACAEPSPTCDDEACPAHAAPDSG